MALNSIRATLLMAFNDSAIRDCLITLVAILLFSAIQRPSGAIAIDLWSSSFAPRQSEQEPFALGLVSVQCH